MDSSSPQHHHPSSIPRPTVSTNVDNFRSTPSGATVPIKTPDALDFYRQHSLPRKPYGGLTRSPSDIARSFEMQTPRSASSPPIDGAKTSPTFIPGTMERSSIKDLVARFNQGSSPDTPKPTWKQQTGNTPTTAKPPHTPSKLQKPRRPSAPTSHPRQRPQESLNSNAIDPKSSSFEGYPGALDADRQQLQSRSTASLLPQQDQKKPPLFGEVMTSPEQWANPGYGIPQRRNRRGSEGNMHHPNPMFHTRSVSDLEAPPSSPPMWRDVESYRNGIPPQSPHQRSRSDTIGVPQENQNNSQSGFPLNTTQEDTSSDLLEINHGTRRRPMTPPELLSPRKYETQRTPGGGQRLKAIISSPSPKVSPPLRSSRPRQDIGEASNLNGRPKTPDTAYSGSPSRNRARNTNGPSPEKRAYMDLGRMDFATRRESIRNAVRKTSDQGLKRALPNAAASSNTAPGQEDTSVRDGSEWIYVGHPEKEGPKLKLEVNDIEHSSASEILTATTEFEEDRTPPPPMPGNFPDDTPGGPGYFEQNKTGVHTNVQQPQIQSSDPNTRLTRQKTVLSQVLEMRKRSARESSQLGPIEGMSADNDDSETIQIMLGDTLMLSREESQNLQGKLRGDDSPTIPQGRTGLSPSASWTTQGNDRTSVSGCLTLDSDAYSVINRVLDHYHESGSISPSMVQEFQQHIVDTDPELLNTKDEDSMNYVAQVALEELIKDHTRLSTMQDMGIPLMHSTANPSSISQGISFEDVHASSIGGIQDFAPVPPPKDRSQTPQAAPGNQANLLPVGYDQSANQSSSTLSEQPVLPEIRATNGGLGLAYGPHSIQTNATQPPSLVPNLPPPPSMAERARSASPSIKTTKAPSLTSTTPQSDAARPVSAQQSIIPEVTLHDTPATSISQKSPEDMSRNVSIDNTSTQNLSPDQKRVYKRKQIIKELVDTEFSYNQDMKVVEDIYMGTANAVDAMTPDDRRVLFGNSVDIVKFSENFLDALKSAVSAVYTMPRNSRWRVKRGSFSTNNSGFTDQSSTPAAEGNDNDNDRKTSIGEAFCKNLSQMERVYGDYLKNHDYANQRLAKLQTIQQVSVWLNECHTYASDITSAWDLDSLLVKPVQRILKYPLLLKALMEVTPEDHPDFTPLNMATKEMLDVSQRINESKKRVELLDQVVNNKQKEFDVTLGLSKAFGRRTEKLRQQVGLTDAVEDPDYKAIAAKFGGQFFQLQVVMRDVEMYKKSVEEFMAQFNRYIESFEEFIDVGMSGSPEIESKWRKFAMIIREMSAIAWVDHETAVRKSCIDPMVALLKMHEGPQKLMAKRKKRLVEYAKYKTLKDRGDKPDKKTTEQGEQFIALNDTLKDELPKLFILTAKLVEACLKNFVDIQLQWHTTWQRKIKPILEKQPIPSSWGEIDEAFKQDFSYTEANALTLGICNGSILADASNFLSSSFSNDPSKASSTVASSRRTTGASENSPNMPQFVHSHTFPYDSARSSVEQHRNSQSRQRSNSALSTQAGQQWPLPPTDPLVHRATTPLPPTDPLANRTPTTATFAHRPPGSSTSSQPRYSGDSSSLQRPVSSSTYYSAAPATHGSNGYSQHSAMASPAQHSGVFSSAMPMSDSPDPSRPASPPARQTAAGEKDFNVLFLAASLFEFNIDRARKEAGYPYLTYVPGEVFDVIAEKGELWLAKNQDDPTNMLGWIWEKHFAKLISDDS